MIGEQHTQGGLYIYLCKWLQIGENKTTIPSCSVASQATFMHFHFEKKVEMQVNRVIYLISLAADIKHCYAIKILQNYFYCMHLHACTYVLH